MQDEHNVSFSARVMQTLMKRFYKRKALGTANPLFYWWRDIANKDRTRRAKSEAPAFNDVTRIVDEIKEQGIIVGPSDRFLSDDGQRALDQAAKMVADLSTKSEVRDTIARGSSSNKKSYLMNLLNQKEHSADSPLARLALDQKLLEIVAGYLQLWPRLHAISAKLNFPTQEDAKEAQLWHRDPEDLKLIKVFIYLVDVGENSGPFSYIPKTQPFSSGATKVPPHEDDKRITDEEMARTFPADTWRACTGPAKTMILADTVGYHRGGKPTEGTRLLITFTYTSGVPFVKRNLRIVGQPTWNLSAMQKAAAL